MDGIKKYLEWYPKSYIPKYDEQMPKEDMLEQIFKELIALPDRKRLKHDGSIFGKHNFSGEDKELDTDNMTEFDPFKRLTTENIIF
jgi:hypothetical protein